MNPIPPSELAAFLDRAGFPLVGAIEPLSGGKNNRVYRVSTRSGDRLAKQYFRHPDDPRNRLRAEWEFSQWAWNRGVRCIPEPIVADEERGLALFEFIPGRSLKPFEVTPRDIDQALDFFRSVNRDRTQAKTLLPASEACFTLADHLRTVSRRVERVRTIPRVSPLSREAAEVVEEQLVPLARESIVFARWQAKQLGLDLDEPLSPDDCCLSPSDFGFHNALLADSDRRLRFLDFEYAGWDDPAKLIGDFFCQPTVPVPLSEFPRFTRAVCAQAAGSDRALARAELLLPVYRVKWICIRLNDFLPVGNSRRQFSTSTLPAIHLRQSEQLNAVRQVLDQLVSHTHPTRMVA